MANFKLTEAKAKEALRRYLSQWNARVTDYIDTKVYRKNSKYLFKVKINGLHLSRHYLVLAGEQPSVAQIQPFVADTTVKAENILKEWLRARIMSDFTLGATIVRKSYFEIKVPAVGCWFRVHHDGLVEDLDHVFDL